MSTRIPPGKLSRGKGAGVGSGRMTGNASVAGDGRHSLCVAGDGRHALWGKRIFQAQVPSGSKPGPLGAAGGSAPWELWSLEELMKVGVERSRVPTLLPRDSRGMDQTPRSVQGSRAGAASWPKPLLETRLRQQGGGQPECEQASSGAAENPPPAPADAGWVPATPSGLRILRRTPKHSVSTDGNTASNGQERG